MADVYTVSQAQANLPKLVKRGSFTISRRGKVIGVYLSKEQVAALSETVELLGDGDFMAEFRNYKAGRTKSKTFI